MSGSLRVFQPTAAYPVVGGTYGPRGVAIALGQPYAGWITPDIWFRIRFSLQPAFNFNALPNIQLFKVDLNADNTFDIIQNGVNWQSRIREISGSTVNVTNLMSVDATKTTDPHDLVVHLRQEVSGSPTTRLVVWMGDGLQTGGMTKYVDLQIAPIIPVGVFPFFYDGTQGARFFNSSGSYSSPTLDQSYRIHQWQVVDGVTYPDPFQLEAFPNVPLYWREFPLQQGENYRNFDSTAQLIRASQPNRDTGLSYTLLDLDFPTTASYPRNVAGDVYFTPSTISGTLFGAPFYDLDTNTLPPDPTWFPAITGSTPSGTIIYPPRPDATMSLNVVASTVAFNFGFTKSSGSRRGVMVAKATGSPQLSLEPVETDPTFLLPGDIWFLASGSTRGQGLYYADTSSTNDIAVHKILTSRDIDSTPALLTASYFTADRPKQLNVAMNTVAADNWFYTVQPNPAVASSSGWYNTTHRGGLWFPDSGTLEVVGDSMSFRIPSGNLEVGNGLWIRSGSFTIATGSLNINQGGLNLTGSVNLFSGSVSVTSGSLLISGTNAQVTIAGRNATATVRGNSIVNVKSGGDNFATLMLSQSFYTDGTVYVNTGSLEIFVKANSYWYIISSGSLDSVIDGGTY